MYWLPKQHKTPPKSQFELYNSNLRELKQTSPFIDYDRASQKGKREHLQQIQQYFTNLTYHNNLDTDASTAHGLAGHVTPKGSPDQFRLY